MDSHEATFAHRLRDLMEAKQISQNELADRVGCSQPAISQMLNRNRRPRKKTILKFAEALNVYARDLWPDIEVAEMLDAIASFQQDVYVMTEAEARALAEKVETESADDSSEVASYPSSVSRQTIDPSPNLNRHPIRSHHWLHHWPHLRQESGTCGSIGLSP